VLWIWLTKQVLSQLDSIKFTIFLLDLIYFVLFFKGFLYLSFARAFDLKPFDHIK
jgi:hypothetical protein